MILGASCDLTGATKRRDYMFMGNLGLVNAVLASIVAMSLSGCVTGTGPSAFGDPFAYCAAVGTIDRPDGRYKGPVMPESVVKGMIRRGIVAADAPPEFQRSATWRCMNHAVWVCHFGANLPCLEKADASRVPTAGMQEYCRANPDSDVIPAAVTGRSTIYEWTCRNGKAIAGKKIFSPDAEGFLSDFWYELAPR